MSYISMPIWLFGLLAFWIIGYTVVTIYLVRKQENDWAYLKNRFEDLTRVEFADVSSIHKSLSRLDKTVGDLKADDIQKMNERIDDAWELIDNRMDSLDAGFNLLMNDLVERGVVEVKYVDLDDTPESVPEAKILQFPAQPPINFLDADGSLDDIKHGSEDVSKPCTDENS